MSRDDAHRSVRSRGSSRSAAVQRLSDAGCVTLPGSAGVRGEEESASPDEDVPEPHDGNPDLVAAEECLPGAGLGRLQPDGDDDRVLIEAVRAGTVSAYGLLYVRHVASAHHLARQLACCLAEADDLVAEAYAKVLTVLRAGRGPDSAFRAYLLTTLRHTAYDKTRRARRFELADDVSQVFGVPLEAISEEFDDTAIEGLERSLVAQAFARLPERWQAVLWHTEIEEQTPAEAAPFLGLTANGVSALAYRAREGLRQAYLQMHLAETTDRHCRAAAERLGAWTRGGLAKREKAQVEDHLGLCGTCRGHAIELATENSRFRGGARAA